MSKSVECTVCGAELEHTERHKSHTDTHTCAHPQNNLLICENHAKQKPTVIILSILAVASKIASLCVCSDDGANGVPTKKNKNYVILAEDGTWVYCVPFASFD